MSDGPPPAPPRVAVIVVLYNSRAVVAACLDGLRATRWPALHAVVVDNASSDDSAAFAEGHALGAEVIRSGVNRGCLLYTSPSPRDISGSRMPSSA